MMKRKKDEDPLSFAAVLERYERYFRLRNFARRSWTSCYRLVLEDLFRFLELEGVSRISEVTREHLRRFQHYLLAERRAYSGRPLKTSTVAVRTAVVRSFFRFAEGEGLVVEDPSSGVRPPKVSRALPRGLLSRRDVLRLVLAPDTDTVLGTRDRAILEVLYGCGVRKSELLGLSVGDIDSAERTIRIRAKGGHARLVPLGRRAFRAVLDYLEGGARERLLSKKRSREEALFISQRGRRLGATGLGKLVKHHAKRAGIERAVTLHGLRHTCATHLLTGGADIRAVQEILGHRSLATTERYTHLATEDLRREILKHHPRERMRE